MPYYSNSEGERLTTGPRAHSFIAEAQTWKETITDSRLPEAELRTVKEKHAVKSSVTSLSEYREKICINGSCNFSGPRNGRRGMRLIEAEEREWPGRYVTYSRDDSSWLETRN